MISILNSVIIQTVTLLPKSIVQLFSGKYVAGENHKTALGVVKNTIQPKRTKAMDMRFHWLRCRTNQKQFRTYWRAGTTNNGDYVTKHHPKIHHVSTRSTYLTSMQKLAEFRKRAAAAIYQVKLTARVC